MLSFPPKSTQITKQSTNELKSNKIIFKKNCSMLVFKKWTPTFMFNNTIYK